MSLILVFFAVLGGLEWLLWTPPAWRFRVSFGRVLIFGVGASSLALFATVLQGWAFLLCVLSFYRLVNLRRVSRGRIQADYLYTVSRRTSLWLVTCQAVIVVIALAGKHYHVQGLAVLYAVAAGQCLGGVLILAATVRNLKAARSPQTKQAYSDASLPTLTVALPARNETDDLEACLQSLVSSDYPKLEIIVLDDCSQNRRTPEIIRGFAHNGVTFIAGGAPPEHWLAKNYAYQQLTDAANGELLLFCGVDTRFQTQSLRSMVEILLESKSCMLSFIPRNRPPSGKNWVSSLVQPARYAWELALPRTAKRPPVLSTCWLIRAETLHAAGSFKAVSRGHSPESYFARYAGRQSDGYLFLRATSQLGLDSLKSAAEQRATAIRTRYPQLHRRPEMVGIITLLQATILAGPLILIITGVALQRWPLTALAAAGFIALTTSYAKIVAITYRRFLLRGLWLLVPSALYDIGLLNYSMWLYEFREVIWKGRNICIPLMRVVSDLPKP